MKNRDRERKRSGKRMYGTRAARARVSVYVCACKRVHLHKYFRTRLRKFCSPVAVALEATGKRVYSRIVEGCEYQTGGST